MNSRFIAGVLITSACLSLLADRADMDRLVTDINNHNRRLGELITAKDTSQIKREAAQLREDARSLARKSTGLAPSEQNRLEQRRDDVATLTERIEKNVDHSEFAAAETAYQRLQTEIERIQSLTSLKEQLRQPLDTVRIDQNQLVTDVQNHNHKLGQVLKSKDGVQVKQETVALREDAKALGKTLAGTKQDPAQIDKEVGAIGDATRHIEKNAAKSEFDDARTWYDKLQANVQTLASLASGGKKSADVRDQPQLLGDVENHNRRLRQAIAARNANEVKEEAFALREDAKALAKVSLAAAPREQFRLTTEVDGVAELTERIEKNADRSDFGDARKLYDKMQVHITQIRSLAPGTHGR
jgi:hypothetical protein